VEKRKAKPVRASKFEVARKAATAEPQPYSRDIHFELHAVVEHPSLGTGVVTAVHADRIDVLFADKPRVLLHKAVP
jgi:hypothetical protein